jgi:hypothetical protein
MTVVLLLFYYYYLVCEAIGTAASGENEDDCGEGDGM